MDAIDYVGSVSWGTLKPDDLINAFLQVVRELNSEEYDRLVSEYSSILPDVGDVYDWSEQQTEDASWLLSDLFDALNELAPEGLYFGAIEGDGADFGFWLICCDVCGYPESVELAKALDLDSCVCG